MVEIGFNPATYMVDEEAPGFVTLSISRLSGDSDEDKVVLVLSEESGATVAQGVATRMWVGVGWRVGWRVG